MSTESKRIGYGTGWIQVLVSVWGTFSSDKANLNEHAQGDELVSLHVELVLPEALLDTVSSVVTPRVVLPATESTSIQKDTHDMTTIKMVGT